MIYGKQNTLEKMNLIQQVMTCCRFLRVIFYGYGVIALLFWFLNCFEIDWLYLFNWLFSIPYQIISLFYRAEGLSADFSLAIISGISLIIGFCIDLGLNSLFQKLVEMEEEEEKKQRNKKLRVKKTISRPKPFLETEETQVNFIDSSLLFLINPHVNKIKKSKSDADLSFQDIE
ncbi:MAG: hypothetical protein LUG16_08000, partial [Candidatus Gastranaerophilales bacterium]|nr:hypothetical protein [Candidatus Gastranaerophilales bacterium]